MLNSSYVDRILQRCSISNGGKNLVNNFNQRIKKLENEKINLTDIESSIIPSENEVYDLGSSDKRFKELFISGNTIKLGSLELKDNLGTFEVTDSNNQNALNLSEIEYQVNENSENINNILNIGISSNYFKLGETINGDSSTSNFGQTLSSNSDGTIVAVGAPNYSLVNSLTNIGQVNVYKYDENNGWNQLGQSIDGTIENENFGESISLSSNRNIIVIGSPNTNNVKTYYLSNNNWVQFGSDIVGNSDDNFGKSLSLSADGTILAIGAPNYNNKGSVKVFKLKEIINLQYNVELTLNLTPGEWDDEISWLIKNSDGITVRESQDYPDRITTDTNLLTETFVLPEGEYTFVGNDSFGDGWNGASITIRNINTNKIYLDKFTFGNGTTYETTFIINDESNDVWTQVGSDIEGEAIGDNFGHSVSLSGDGNILVVGAPYNENKGEVKIYQLENNNWIQYGNTIEDGEINQLFGNNVSINSTKNLIAVVSNNSAYIYKLINNNWEIVGNKISVNSIINSLSLSDNGSVIALGLPFDNNNLGKVSVYQLENNNWNKVNDFIGENVNQELGTSVSLNNDGSKVISSSTFNGLSNGQVESYEYYFNINSNQLDSLKIDGDANFQDNNGNINSYLYLNIINVTSDLTVAVKSSGIYKNTSSLDFTLTLESDSSKNILLKANTSQLVYTSDSEIFNLVAETVI